MSSTGIAQIYKWVDADGKTHFSSSPPIQGEAEIVNPKPNTVVGRKLTDSNSSGNKSGNEVVMYSSAWCGDCKTARVFFNQNDIPYKEYDIETSHKGKRDYKRLKGLTVPLIMVGDERLDGFDPEKFLTTYGAE